MMQRLISEKNSATRNWNLTQMTRLVKRLLLYSETSSVRFLDQTELQTSVPSHTWLINSAFLVVLWWEYNNAKSKSKKEDCMLTITVQSSCAIKRDTLYIWVQHSTCWSWKLIFCLKNRCARKICKKALIIMIFTCRIDMTDSYSKCLKEKKST